MASEKKTIAVKGHTVRGVRDIDVDVGRRLRMIRMTSNMSQNDVAARTGVSFQQIQKYENGVNRISAGRLLEFCVIFDTTPHELLGWKEKKINAKVNGETFKLVQAFAMLPEKRKPLIRSLIEGLLRE